jgi:hypothetical protein
MSLLLGTSYRSAMRIGEQANLFGADLRLS